MNHSQQIAAFLTAIFAFLTVLVLCLTFMPWPEGKIWPPEPVPYIEMAQAEEFIEPVELPVPKPVIGDEEAPAKAEEDIESPNMAAPESGTQRQSEGDVAEPARNVTTTRPSPAKVQTRPKPSKTGANEKTDRQKNEAAARRTDNEMANTFAQSRAKNNGRDNKESDTRSGRLDGKNTNAARAKARGNGNLGGYFSWPPLNPGIVSEVLGSLVVEFTINPDGSVRDARYRRPTTIPPKVAQACEKYVLSLRFPFRGTDRPDGPLPGNTLRFNFEN